MFTYGNILYIVKRASYRLFLIVITPHHFPSNKFALNSDLEDIIKLNLGYI